MVNGIMSALCKTWIRSLYVDGARLAEDETIVTGVPGESYPAYSVEIKRAGNEICRPFTPLWR